MVANLGALFEGEHFVFDQGFLHDHAGQLITEARVAIIELTANAYDAGALLVGIEWPADTEQRFSVFACQGRHFDSSWDGLSRELIIRGPCIFHLALPGIVAKTITAQAREEQARRRRTLN